MAGPSTSRRGGAVARSRKLKRFETHTEQPHPNAQPYAGLLDRASVTPRLDRNISCLAAVTQVIFKSEKQMIERMVAMLRRIRRHREINRTRRELNRAIANASTPAMRDELILVAQRSGIVF
jgi:hypothetical protein